MQDDARDLDIEPPKGALSVIFLIVFMDLLGFGIIIPLLPLFAKQFHASNLQIGLVFSIFSAFQFFASPILGAISDRFGRRPILIFSQLGSAIGYALLGLAMQVHWANPFFGLIVIYASRMIDGISGGNISAAQAYISDVTTPKNRAKGMGMLGAAFGCGFALGPAAAALLVPIHPALPGYFACAMSLVAMTMTIVRLQESRIHKPADATNWLHPRRFTPIFQSPRLVQLLLIGFVSMTAFAMLETVTAQFVSSKAILSFKDWQVGLYYAYLGLIIVAVQGGLIGRLTKRFGEWPLAILGPFFVALGMLGFVGVSATPMLWLLLLSGLVNATGRSLQTPTLYALISRNSNPRQQGVVFGLNQGLSSIARMLGPLAAEKAFSYRLAGPYALAAAITLLAGIWTLLLRFSVGRASARREA